MIGWRWEIVIEEAEPRIVGTVGGWLLPSASFAIASGAVEALSQAILGHIEGRIKENRLLALLDLPQNNPSSPLDYSEIERKATFIFKTETGKYTRFSIPTVGSLQFVPETPFVTDVFLQDIASVILSGPFCNSSFIPISSFHKGVKAFGKAS
jgi:hypothetical protein